LLFKLYNNLIVLLILFDTELKQARVDNYNEIIFLYLLLLANKKLLKSLYFYFKSSRYFKNTTVI